MKTEEIIAGIEAATTREEMAAHLNAVERAVDRWECDFSLTEWAGISDAIKAKHHIFFRMIHDEVLVAEK